MDTHGEHAIQQMLLSHPLLTLGAFAEERYLYLVNNVLLILINDELQVALSQEGKKG